MLIIITLPIITENKHLLSANWLKRRWDELFLSEELDTFQALSGKKVAKRVKMPISLLFPVTEQDNAYQNLNQRLRFFPHGSKTRQTKDSRSPCRSLSPASSGVEWHPQPYSSGVTKGNQECDCRAGMTLGMTGASENWHPSQISVPLCLHCCC